MDLQGKYLEIKQTSDEIEKLSSVLVNRIDSRTPNELANNVKLFTLRMAELIKGLSSWSSEDELGMIERIKYFVSSFDITLEGFSERDREEMLYFFDEWVVSMPSVSVELNAIRILKDNNDEPLEYMEKIDNLLHLILRLLLQLNRLEHLGKRKEAGFFVKEPKIQDHRGWGPASFNKDILVDIDSSPPGPSRIPQAKTDKEEAFESIRHRLKKGYSFFGIPPVMKLGMKERIVASISESLKQLKKKYPEKEIAEINIGQVMQLKLKGEHFKIEALNNEVQVLKEKTVTDWNWDVTPLKSGRQQLILLISTKIKISATGTDMQDLPIEERIIDIKVNIPYSVRQFLIKNWQWMIGTLVGSGITITILKIFKVIS